MNKNKKLILKNYLQFFASKKGVGSSKNNRDSHSKRLGMKASDGQKVLAGTIIYRQRGTKFFNGKNAGLGKDFTIFALKDGVVQYKNKTKTKKIINII
ncbi:50S ribosomal protein L27 [symbiont of Argiope bruennichi]|uniref:50S ribosomal protein L27 n=1 Tax=symbiont of Argiope bruennichi TaxID=2810479 RepID=UPI003DA5FC1C